MFRKCQRAQHFADGRSTRYWRTQHLLDAMTLGHKTVVLEQLAACTSLLAQGEAPATVGSRGFRPNAGAARRRRRGLASVRNSGGSRRRSAAAGSGPGGSVPPFPEVVRVARRVPVPVAQQRASAAGRMRGQRRGERGALAPARAVAAVGGPAVPAAGARLAPPHLMSPRGTST